jgi:putative membrane protein insertion efficiency factor
VAAFVCLLLVVSLAADLARPPARQLTSRAALIAIRWYQSAVSPHIGGQCRFTPTCSAYARMVIERHGALEGGWLAAKRIARCGPWTPAGTTDLPR